MRHAPPQPPPSGSPGLSFGNHNRHTTTYRYQKTVRQVERRTRNSPTTPLDIQMIRGGRRSADFEPFERLPPVSSGAVNPTKLGEIVIYSYNRL